MAIKGYWVYQKRDVTTPWALYVVKEYDKRKPAETTLDFTLYHEDIPNQVHCKSFIGLHYDTVSGYVDAILCEFAEYAVIDAQDKEQLMRSVEDILLY